MSDEKSMGVNPHTGQALPPAPEAPPEAAPAKTPAIAIEGLPPAAKQVGPPQWSATPSQQDIAVRAALETVMDPELGLSVMDLGLIREIHFVGGRTIVRMMLTTPFCPFAPQMMADVKQACESVVPQPCDVDMLADAWNPEMMTDPGLLGYSY